jgi:carbamoyl-phosphate synthase large subunit
VKIPTSTRIFAIRDAMLAGASVEELYDATKIDRWFLHNIKQIVDLELELRDLARA